MSDRDRGGRPQRRGAAKRAPRLRVTRVETRRRYYDRERGTATDTAGEIAAVSDYLRGALRRNPALITAEDKARIGQALDRLELAADQIFLRAAKQANREGNTPRRKRKEDAA